MLLLKIQPNDLVKHMHPTYTTNERLGREERVYSEFSSGEYPILIQKEVHDRYLSDFEGRKPLIIYLSLFIDGALMNSTGTRSAIPIIISVLNDKKKNCTLVGFNAKDLHISEEVLDIVLQRKGIQAKSTRADILQLALRQLNWDICYRLICPFQQRQEVLKGFDVQIGIGTTAEFHRVYFVFTNFTGDHPQIHENTGIKSNACHICTKNFSLISR